MVYIFWTVGHRLTVALSNCFLLSVSAKALKFFPFYFCEFVCWAHEVHGEKCENLSLYSHVSLGSTSQQTVEQPKWLWDALCIHKDTLDPCCPIAICAGGHGPHGGAAWPGWAVTPVSRHHPEQQDLALRADRAEWAMEQRHTDQSVLALGDFLPGASGHPVKPLERGTGTSPDLLELRTQAPPPAWAEDPATCPLHWLQLWILLRLNSCHTTGICMCHCLNFASLLGD